MSKIKFNKEWYRDNDIVINCRAKEEADKFINELAKVEITEWSSGDELKLNNRFNSYKSETCYRLEQDYTISYCSTSYFKKDYSIIKFSDLEFESDVIDKYLKTMTDTKIEAYTTLINSCTVDKPEPIKTNTPIKRTILRGDVKLEEGDIVCVHYDYNDIDMIGIITKDYILYNTGDFDVFPSSDIIKDKLLWYIHKSDMKDIGYKVGRLLFKGKLDDDLKNLIIHVQDKPKELIKKDVEVFSVKFCKTDLGLSNFISDSEEIFVEDIVCPTRGEYEDLYGEVINIQCKELSEEELKSYNKIIKIK